MKNAMKLYSVQGRMFGVIALAAVIGISMTALSLTGCPTPAGGGDNSGGGESNLPLKLNNVSVTIEDTYPSN